MTATILVVDDESNIVELNRMYLENAGYRVITARTGAEALARIENEHPDLPGGHRVDLCFHAPVAIAKGPSQPGHAPTGADARARHDRVDHRVAAWTVDGQFVDADGSSFSTQSLDDSLPVGC